MCLSYQGSKGISQKDDELMQIPILIHKITPSIDYNWWLKRLDTDLIEPTKQNQ